MRALATSEPAGAGTSTVAREANLPRATVHRLLVALNAEGFVDRESSGRWHLGHELHFLGIAARTRYDLAAVAQPHVRRLAQTTGESAFYSARRGDETVCLIQEEGDFPIRSHVLHEGVRFPLGVVSAGLVILSYLPEREIDEYFARTELERSLGPQHSEAAIRSRIDGVLRDGWATNPGLIVEGSWGMAAAVFDSNDQPLGALTLTGIEQRFNDDRRPELGASLLREAHRLTTVMRRHIGAR